eukprot:919290_1
MIQLQDHLSVSEVDTPSEASRLETLLDSVNARAMMPFDPSSVYKSRQRSAQPLLPHPPPAAHPASHIDPPVMISAEATHSDFPADELMCPEILPVSILDRSMQIPALNEEFEDGLDLGLCGDAMDGFGLSFDRNVKQRSVSDSFCERE